MSVESLLATSGSHPMILITGTLHARADMLAELLALSREHGLTGFAAPRAQGRAGAASMNATTSSSTGASQRKGRANAPISVAWLTRS